MQLPLLRLSWLLGATLCLLLLQQHPVSADPRPDFTVEFTLYGTSHVATAIADNLLEVSGLSGHLLLDIDSQYPLLLALAQLVQNVGTSLVNDVTDLATLLTQLVESNSSEEYGKFDEVLARIQSVIDSFDLYLASIAERLSQFPGTCLTAQLTDQLLCIRRGLQDLYDALSKLKAGIRPLLDSGESSEEHERSCRNLPIRYIYQVTYALRALRTLLPAVRYTLLSIVDNIRTADAYLVRLASEAGEAQSTEQYLEQINATYVHTAVRERIDTVLLGPMTGLAAERAAVNALSNLQGIQALQPILNALTRMEGALQPGSNPEVNFHEALVAIGTHLATVLTDLDIPRVDNSEVVRELILGLLSGCAYGRYCFYKYSELLFSLAGTGVAGVENCIHRERERLDYLRDTLLRLVTALAFDFEDLAETLAVCNTLSVRADRADCLRNVSPSYVALSRNYDNKFNNLLATGRSEAIAVKNRLAACVRVLQASILDGALDELLEEIRQCKVNGPADLPPFMPEPVPVQ
ncbi:uncharacterized protein LOC118464139 [Anopheles albimanus]|uniref:Protein TsetseEP domain-containing protein n=1 Tax=Anopheles albimanus TaxID=7167 RepID=A0A182FG73_ANOAL|nr:uncharacterized protein LOC118464139 [Anopheles albimanus]